MSDNDLGPTLGLGPWTHVWGYQLEDGVWQFVQIVSELLPEELVPPMELYLASYSHTPSSEELADLVGERRLG